MITDGPFPIELTKKGWLNFADVQMAVEVYTPMCALLLTRNDFIRASNSLQLDEIIAVYIAKILRSDYHLAFMKNGHPLAPLATVGSGFRLMMHGLDCEALHGYLRLLKRRQAGGLPLIAEDSHLISWRICGAPLWCPKRIRARSCGMGIGWNEHRVE